MVRKEIGLYIDRTYKIVRQDLINRFKENEIDLTPEQWVLVSKLHKEGDLFQTDLASYSFRDKPTVSRIVDLLVKKRIVSKTQDRMDGRKYLVSLTEEGRALVDAALPVVAASREQGWTNLTTDEYETLVQTLDKIFSNYMVDSKE